uniref:Cell surface hydrophobicity-associated protein n=1 Tax=Ganoderma boninense TaxID=34458 RepID=A0A5K1JVT0_9APHY
MSLPKTTREYRLPKADGFHNLTLQESPIPTLKSTEVLVKIHAVSLQNRDLIVANGQYPVGQKDNLVPVSDMAGEIIAVGEDVKGWKLGERVSANFALDHIHGVVTAEIKASALGGPVDGVLTEYKAFPAHALVRIPEHLSYEEASTLPCTALTAYNALLGGNPVLKGGDTVLVQGTGGVSISGLQLAVASGATVIVTSSSDQKLEVAKKLGATHLINYERTPNWELEVLRVTNGRGVDHILEVGGPGTVTKSAMALAFGGNMAIIGIVAGLAGDVSSLPLLVLGKAASMRGIHVGSRAQFEDMNRLIEAVKLKPVVDKVFDFEHAIDAYEYQEKQQHVGKVVVRMSKD